MKTNYLSVRILLEQDIHVSITDGENLTNGFSANKQSLIFKAGLTPAVMP